MSFLLRTCFRGQSKQARDTIETHYDEMLSSEAGACARAEVVLLSNNPLIDIKGQELPLHHAVCNGAYPRIHTPTATHAGGHGLYDTTDYRTLGVGAPSFTLCAIAEDEADEDEDEDGPCGNHKHIAASARGPSALAALTAAQQPGDGCGSNDVILDYHFNSEPCAFAIILPAPLSTVFEEEGAEDCDSTPSGSCHSADAGCGGGNVDLPVTNLIRGLSAPTCASSSLPSGGSGSSSGGVPCSISATALRSQTPIQRCARGTSTSTKTGARGLVDSSEDPGAVWYF